LHSYSTLMKKIKDCHPNIAFKFSNIRVADISYS